MIQSFFALCLLPKQFIQTDIVLKASDLIMNLQLRGSTYCALSLKVRANPIHSFIVFSTWDRASSEGGGVTNNRNPDSNRYMSKEVRMKPRLAVDHLLHSRRFELTANEAPKPLISLFL